MWQYTRILFSINDPRWGRNQESNDSARQPQDRRNSRKDSQSLPDLDKIWHDFNRRIKRILGRRGSSLDPGNVNNSRGRHLGMGIVISVLVAIYLANGIYIVQEGQAGVVLQFGKYQYTTGSGIQWRLPYPFQSNEIVNMSQVRSIEIGRDNMIHSTNLKDMSMLTKDENIIDVCFAVQYHVKDPAAFLFNNANAESTVTQAAETAVREIVGKNTMDYVLYEGREQIGLQLLQQIQGILDQYKTGIIVSSVTMQNVQPPQQVQSAFDDAVKAGQDRERSKSEALAYANNVVPLAQGTTARMVADAHGYRARTIAKAEGDAERFKSVQAEYIKAPAVTRERMYLDTMQQIYSNITKVIVDSKTGSHIIYLPLDKIMSQHHACPQTSISQSTSDNSLQEGVSLVGSSSSGLAVPAQTMPSVFVGDDLSRSRDLLFRSRSRNYDQ
ncbi:FtsH protease activity modulator HflK [Candidatus Vallotia cooleyia]|uniref:FtsH protease activity modulator HflK n=1 Tax=Candidatus Vallotiella adelgis TaxID=1177211 RepID=UPI001D002553|nr:FtsH protease activity modulator HflK [Candidatus Vallotia cooleyia]UDG81952.1 Modulator of FtsH protease HflK [Candidatus Vallotia cooleyia]